MPLLPKPVRMFQACVNYINPSSVFVPGGERNGSLQQLSAVLDWDTSGLLYKAGYGTIPVVLGVGLVVVQVSMGGLP